MANSSNAYATVRPLQGSISDWVMNQEAADMRLREEKRRQEQLDLYKQEKQREREDKLRERLLGNLPQNYDTGSSSLNEFQAGIIKQGVNRLGEIYNELKNPNIPDAQKTKLEIEAQQIENLPTNLKIATDNFTKLIGEYQKGVEDGSLWRNEEFEKKVLNGFENYVGGLDENGFPLVGFQDKDGDGKMDIMSYDNLSQGIGVWEFQPKTDWAKVTAEAGKLIGVSEEGKPLSGYRNQVTKGITLADAQKAAENLVVNSDGSLTATAKSRLRELGLEESPEAIAALKADAAERIMMSKDRSDVTKKDWGAANSAARLAFDRSKEDKNSNPISFVEKTANGTSFALKTPYTFQSKNKNNQPGTISAIELDNNGNIVLKGVVNTGKVSKKTYGKEEVTTSEDRYEETTIKDKKEVTAILSGITGLDSYTQIQQALQEEANKRQPAVDEYGVPITN